MTSGGNSLNDFLEIVPTRKLQPKQRRLFSFSRPWPRAYFLNGPNAAASTDTVQIGITDRQTDTQRQTRRQAHTLHYTPLTYKNLKKIKTRLTYNVGLDPQAAVT